MTRPTKIKECPKCGTWNNVLRRNICRKCNGRVRGSAASICSADDALAKARRERLWECLETLSAWCARRAGKEYNTDTTITMLAKKVQDIMHSVDKAGWRASKQYEQSEREQP